MLTIQQSPCYLNRFIRLHPIAAPWAWWYFLSLSKAQAVDSGERLSLRTVIVMEPQTRDSFQSRVSLLLPPESYCILIGRAI